MFVFPSLVKRHDMIPQVKVNKVNITGIVHFTQGALYNPIMPKKVRELLFQIGLVLGAIVIGKLLDSPFGYVIAAILAIAFITQWLLQREESEREAEMEGLFGGPILLGGGRQASEIELPEVRPKIVPVDYCKAEKDNLYGLRLRNSGYDAGH
jgi:hypothetical protein